MRPLQLSGSSQYTLEESSALTLLDVCVYLPVTIRTTGDIQLDHLVLTPERTAAPQRIAELDVALQLPSEGWADVEVVTHPPG